MQGVLEIYDNVRETAVSNFQMDKLVEFFLFLGNFASNSK